MNKTHDWKTICLLVALLWLAVTVPGSAYMQTSVGGYLFSIPGFNDAEKRTQADAQTWCTGNQSQLLEITSDNIQRATVSFINFAIANNQMTGNTVATNGKRFNVQLTWVNNIPCTSGVSVKGQEAGLNNSYGYLNSSQGGFDFYVESPIVTKGYICEGTSFCAGGFTTNGRCYMSKSNGTMLSWFDARNQCTAGGGDLASFEFIADTNGFSALSGSGWNPPNTYWIGLRRQTWTWQGTNSDAVYSQWSSGHPNYGTNQYSECLCLLPNNPYYDWKWIECDCSQKYQFVCIRELTSSTAPRTSPGTSNTISMTSSTTVETTHLLSQPSSVSSSGSTSRLSTTVLSSSTSADSSFSGSLCSGAIGLGVGLGVGIPAVIIVLILFVIIVQQKRKLKSFETNRNIPSAQVAAKEENAPTTYESLRDDRKGADNPSYEELRTLGNRQSDNN